MASKEDVARMKEEKRVRELITTLNDEQWPVRQAAAEALGDLKARLAVAQLIETLGDEDPWVRWSTATALGKIDDMRAVKPLMECLQDKHFEVRRATAEALSMMSGDQSLKAIGALKAAGFNEEARKLRFQQLSQAFDTAETVRRDLEIIRERKREGTAGQVEHALLEDHAQKLEEALAMARDAGDTNVIGEVTALIEAVSHLRPSQQTNITDSVINRSNLNGIEEGNDNGNNREQLSIPAHPPRINEISHTDPLNGVVTDPKDDPAWEGKVSDFLELMEGLKELVKMKEQGLLSEEEFAAAKAKLL